jgi:hypothetical protein
MSVNPTAALLSLVRSRWLTGGLLRGAMELGEPRPTRMRVGETLTQLPLEHEEQRGEQDV